MKKFLKWILILTLCSSCSLFPEKNVEVQKETKVELTEDQSEEKINNQEEEKNMQLAKSVEIVDFDTESGFVRLKDVIPNLIEEVCYATDYNFTGHVVDGYEEPIAIVTNEMARALQRVNQRANEYGFWLKVYDAYRPLRAVTNFVIWSWNDDQSMKEVFYPNINKTNLFELGYLSDRSYHCLGSTVDLTLVDMRTGEEVDMGTPFDFLDPTSYPDTLELGEEVYNNRMFLRMLMNEQGFIGIETEWWHFQLEDQPYWELFDFPVSAASIYN